VPLDRLQEGLQNLNILAEKMKEKQLEFAHKTLRYLLRTWINGQYEPKSWNLFDHDGVSTNNYHVSTMYFYHFQSFYN
jgi:hypothetical protein